MPASKRRSNFLNRTSLLWIIWASTTVCIRVCQVQTNGGRRPVLHPRPENRWMGINNSCFCNSSSSNSYWDSLEANKFWLMISIWWVLSRRGRNLTIVLWERKAPKLPILSILTHPRFLINLVNCTPKSELRQRMGKFIRAPVLKAKKQQAHQATSLKIKQWSSLLLLRRCGTVRVLTHKRWSPLRM